MMMEDEIYKGRKGGYKFYFQEGDYQVACYASFFSGKEEVYLNDDLVSSKRHFGFKSTHQFDIEGEKYSVCYDLINPLSGKVNCTFLKGRKNIATQSQSMFSKKPKSAVSVILICFLVGFVFGAFAYKLGKFLVGWN